MYQILAARAAASVSCRAASSTSMMWHARRDRGAWRRCGWPCRGRPVHRPLGARGDGLQPATSCTATPASRTSCWRRRQLCRSGAGHVALLGTAWLQFTASTEEAVGLLRPAAGQPAELSDGCPSPTGAVRQQRAPRTIAWPSSGLAYPGHEPGRHRGLLAAPSVPCLTGSSTPRAVRPGPGAAPALWLLPPPAAGLLGPG